MIFKPVAMKILVSGWLVMLAGCVGEIRQPFDEKAQLPDRAVSFVVGQTDQAAVRDLLGEPHLTSRYWQFDLFRDASAQGEVVVAMPVPVPFARFEDDLYRYTLVTYQGNRVVAGIDSGLFRSHSGWRPPLENNYQSLSIASGNYTFFIDSKDDSEGILLLSSAAKDAYLKDHPDAAACRLFISCTGTVCADTLRLDSEPTRLIPWPLAIAELSTPPGDHVLKFSDRRFSDKVAMDFSCVAGSATYFTVGPDEDKVKDSAGELMHAFLFGLTLGAVKLDPVDWELKIYPAPPEEFADRPLIIWRDGIWLANPELDAMLRPSMDVDTQKGHSLLRDPNADL